MGFITQLDDGRDACTTTICRGNRNTASKEEEDVCLLDGFF